MDDPDEVFDHLLPCCRECRTGLTGAVPMVWCVARFAFFRASDGAAPVSMGVTAILSTAVLLNNVTSQLPSVSYTVALEWGYYAFILLAAGCVLIAMLRKRLAAVHRDDAERRLSRAARVGYPVYLLGVVATYVVVFT